jgi:hypothetical protein
MFLKLLQLRLLNQNGKIGEIIPERKFLLGSFFLLLLEKEQKKKSKKCIKKKKKH